MKSKEIDMIHGPLMGKLIVFALPVLLSSILQLLFNAADIIVVGRFAGDQALAAVGSTGSLINLLLGLFMGLSIGANVVAAQYYGAGEKEKMSDTVHTSLLLGLVCGVIVMIVGYTLSPYILKLMGSPKDVLPLATIYLRIYFLGMPGSLVYNFGAALLRAVGNTSTPLYFLSFAGLVNVILNLFLVIYCKMGVAGVGIATVASMYISASLILFYMSKSQDAMKFSVKKLHINMDIFKKIMRIGIPSGIQGTVFSLSNVVIQSAINSFGSVVVAGNAAAQNVEGFVYMAMNSLYQTAITFTGQNYGAGEKKRILKVLLRCQLLVIIVGLSFGNACYIFGDKLLHFYTKSDVVVAAGLERMRYICTVYFLCGIMDVMVGSLRGIGKSVVPMVTSILGACVFRLIWIATIFDMFHTPGMLYICYAISWIITFSAHIVYFTVQYRKLGSKIII